ncbi:MAG: Gfo/Idh/MocA family oxidoreductase [Planctomycetes bacterium]|nr:Gfo/Idh/MocA family oxidoreductase [Planctomycetota bacterium]
MDTDLRAVVVGVGHLGRHHARLMQQVPGVELVGVVDPDSARAAGVAEPLGVEVFTSVEQVPDDVRVASVAVPTSLHHAITCPLLRRGVHVLVEKPMAVTLAEAAEMRALADERGLVLQVGHVERFNPALRALSDLDLVPRFIEAHRLAPFNYRTLDVSVVMDLMIHDIDIVLQLAGSPLARLEAVGSRVLGRQVDIANARLHFENGCVANVTASRVSFEPLRRTRVFSDEGFVSLDFATRRAFVVTRAEGFDLGSLDAAAAAHVQPKDSFKEFVAQGLLDAREIDMDATNPLLDELTAFVGAVRGETGAGVSAAEGMRAMEVALQIGDAIAAHRWT